MREIAALAIFLATVTAIVVRPSKIPEWLAALAGVAAMVAIGAESALDAWRAALAQWDVLLFFAGLMTVIAIAESAGFFAWVAFVAARAAHGSARRLFLAIVVACALITVLLTNDAAALVMTPLVFGLGSGLRLRPLPYAFACTFMANGASVVLPISNPVNVMLSESGKLTLTHYIALLWLPSLLAAGATAIVLWFALGRTLRRRFDVSLVIPPDADRSYRLEVTILLVITAIALVAVSASGGLVGVAACTAGLVLLCHAALRGRFVIRRLLSDVNPAIVVLVAALFALAEGVVKSGLLRAPLLILERMAASHPGLAGPAMAVATAAASNLFNNLPTAALATAVLHHGVLSVEVVHRIAAGAIVGCDLGPSFTTVGSLSTLLWLVLLRRRGLEVSPFEYARLGLLVAPAALAVAVAGLLLTTR